MAGYNQQENNDFKYVCKSCDFKCFKQSNLDAHNLTRKHFLLASTSKKCQPTFDCSLCDVKCCYNSVYERHIKTKQHLKNIDKANKEKMPYKCIKCNKLYDNYSGFWQHSKKCDVCMPTDNIYDVVNKLLTDNKELRNFIIEQATEHKNETVDIMSKALECHKSTNNTTINGNVNNNQKFNINLFLNEQCKNAWNFNDFINKIQISYADLENNAQLGFVAGISKIFLDNLKLLDINERPIHCTDIKRETMYIKDEDKWNKESDDTKLQKAIQTVSYKSMGKLMEWKQENPDYQNMDSEFSKRCLDMQRQTLAGSDRDVYYPKVIHVLAKETMVDK